MLISPPGLMSVLDSIIDLTPKFKEKVETGNSQEYINIDSE